MKIAKLFKLGKKGAKKAKTSKGAAGSPSKWPAGTKIGIFGHQNSGKTVYFTVLHNECKVSKNLKIAVTDKATSFEFLYNYRALWGIAPSSEGGTIIDTFEAKKFPDPTVKDRVLQFTAILDGKTKMPVVTFDYNGKSVGISEQTDEAEKVKEFMTSADGILFFFDPKILGAEVETQARASAFVNILEKIVPLRSRLPIPVALVVTKADTLPGFDGESKTVLVNPEDEQFFAENYDVFLEKVLESSNVASDTAWASTVRNILVKLRDFIGVVVGRTLDFQIFFVSSTGNKPVKIGTDIGRSIYQPPEKINPCGVKEPFYWILGAIARSKRLGMMRKVARFVAAVSIIWMVIYSIPFWYHFNLLFSRANKVETTILKSVDGNHMRTSEDQRSNIIRAYRRYGNSWLVKKFYPDYQLAATQMKDIYEDFNIGPAITRLDSIITSMTAIVGDPSLQPKYNPGIDSLILSEDQVRMVKNLEELAVGDKTSILVMRSGRVLKYWDLYTQLIKNPGDTAVVDNISWQVAYNTDNENTYSKVEARLGDALLGAISAAPAKKPRTTSRSVRSVLADFDQIKEKVNDSKDPAYILGEVPDKLKRIRGSLRAGVHDKQIAAIDKFLREADKYGKKRNYTAILSVVPDIAHIHIEVIDSDKQPTWSKSEEQGQLLEGSEVVLRWKIGDDIHIAFDELGFPCTWGTTASDRRVFEGKYSLFELEGRVTFPNIGKSITISFKGGLKDKLPGL